MTTPSQQLGWINNLRFISLVAVVILHTAAIPLGLYGKIPHSQWLAADFYNALTRFAVPVFVMITGALLLGRNDELFAFLQRRLLRVLTPFLFWSLVYVAYAYYNQDLKYTGNAWLTVKQVLHQLKYGASYHLWYVYMLIGLYLIIPVLNPFIRSAGDKELRYFLIVWLVVMLISQPYLERYNPQVDGRYFSGYIGYLVLGYYLANRTGQSWHFLAGMLGFAIMVAVISIGTNGLYKHYNGISTLLYEPLSPAVVLLSAAMFWGIKAAQFKVSPQLLAIRDFMGRYSYGIYLAHALVLLIIQDWGGLIYDHEGWKGVDWQLFNPWFSIPFTALVALGITWLLVYLISKIPVVGKFIAG